MTTISGTKVLQEPRSTSPHLLQELLRTQDNNEYNYISDRDVGRIAKELGVTRCRVYSTASFYSEISLEPRGRNIIRICTNAPCVNAGKEAVHQHLDELLDIKIGQTTKDRNFTLESVNCLGGCYMSPVIKINDEIYGNLKPEDLEGILATYGRCNDHD